MRRVLAMVCEKEGRCSLFWGGGGERWGVMRSEKSENGVSVWEVPSFPANANANDALRYFFF